MLDANLLHKAKFSVLKQLHENEKNNHDVKLAPSLSHKAFNPPNTERQSVSLMFYIFSEKVVTGLKLVSKQQHPNFNKAAVDDTLVFVDIIVSFWIMLHILSKVEIFVMRNVVLSEKSMTISYCILIVFNCLLLNMYYFITDSLETFSSRLKVQQHSGSVLRFLKGVSQVTR
jgi:hypothetical protein